MNSNQMNCASQLIKIEAKIMETRANLLVMDLEKFAICLLQSVNMVDELCKFVKLNAPESEYFLAADANETNGEEK